MHDWHKRTGTACITAGIGYGRTELSAFDAAELDANILATNAVKVSSFVPPRWRIVNDKITLADSTGNGAFLPMAYAYAVSNRSKVAASLLVGVNRDTTKASIIVEHADVNITRARSLEQSTMAIDETFAARGWVIERLEKAAVEAEPKAGLYACALVAVVFLLDQDCKDAAGHE